MIATASSLRKNIYKLLDQVADKGEPLFVRRKGRVLRIDCEQPADKLSRLARHDCIRGNPNDLVHMDWSSEWRHDLP